jgi:hypothetical protein
MLRDSSELYLAIEMDVAASGALENALDDVADTSEDGCVADWVMVEDMDDTCIVFRFEACNEPMFCSDLLLSGKWT